MQHSETTIKQRCDIFEDTPWAEGMSSYEVQAASVYMHMVQVNSGEVILKEGGRNPNLYIIVKGKVQVAKQNDKNQSTVIATLNAGKSFGEMSILDGEPHSADVVAVEDSSLLVLTKEKLNQLVLEKPAIGAKLLLKLARLLSQRLRIMNGKIVDYL